jgi:hypothetical protein
VLLLLSCRAGTPFGFTLYKDEICGDVSFGRVRSTLESQNLTNGTAGGKVAIVILSVVNHVHFSAYKGTNPYRGTTLIYSP